MYGKQSQILKKFRTNEIILTIDVMLKEFGSDVKISLFKTPNCVISSLLSIL